MPSPLHLAPVLLLGATAFAGAQIPIPNFNSTSSGALTRGFWFTAPAVPFVITGLRVPNEANQPFQVVEIIDLGTTPPPAFPATVTGTQLFFDNASNAVSVIPCSVLIPPGRVIGVLGACTSSQGGGTAYSSYGLPSGPFTSNILGTPVTLTRLLTQTNIATGGNRPVSQENGGQISRVEVYVAPATGLYANFRASVTTGPAPLNVNFTDLSHSGAPGGVTSWAWDLDGDSVTDSTLQNPTFVYAACGDQTVSLTVTDATNPASTLTRTAYIRTGDIPVPGFTHAVLSPGVVQFTDTTAPAATSWAWDLDGDNVTDSTAQHPVWYYPQPCTSATVSLTVQRACRGPFTTARNLALSPNTFTTVTTGGNGTQGIGSGNTFDVQVTNPGGVVICGLSMCPYMVVPVPGAPLACTVWVTDAAGGAMANHGNAAAWREVATGTGRYAGGSVTAPVPVVMVLSQTIYLPAGSWGMAVHMTGGSGVMFSNLTGPQTYTGPDCNVTCGNAKVTPFAAAATPDKAWNGSIHYCTSAHGQAGYGYLGGGCAGSLGIPGNTAVALPRLGQTMSVTLSRVSMNAAFFIAGASSTSSAFGPLPVSLAPLGAPGCQGRVSTDAVVLGVGAGNSVSFGIAVPNNAAYLGTRLYTQGLALDTPVNVLGAVTSDAAALLVGR